MTYTSQNVRPAVKTTASDVETRHSLFRLVIKSAQNACLGPNFHGSRLQFGSTEQRYLGVRTTSPRLYSLLQKYNASQIWDPRHLALRRAGRRVNTHMHTQGMSTPNHSPRSSMTSRNFIMDSISASQLAVYREELGNSEVALSPAHEISPGIIACRPQVHSSSLCTT